jgi:two-component system, cell cycle sensor histidine kinase and response regulator CckA
MPSPTAADVSGISRKRKDRFRRRALEWLLNPEHFHFKLLVGTSIGVVVIGALAAVCVIVTSTDQKREEMRAQTVEVMRLSNVVENDIAAMENAYRGNLLQPSVGYTDSFKRLQVQFRKHSEELAGLVKASQDQTARVLTMRQNIENWFASSLVTAEQLAGTTTDQTKIRAALSSRGLEAGHDTLQALLREEQIQLNQRVGEREWAIQSTQILNFIPKIERAVYDMQKEKRAYILTGDPIFIDAYKRATSDFYTFHGYLSVLVANDPVQIAQLTSLRETLENWITQSVIPEIEAKRSGRSLPPSHSDGLLNNIRRILEQFDKEQADLYHLRLAAAARERILTLSVINLFCFLAAGLMIASGTYNFVLYRRQLKKLDGADARIRSVTDHIIDGMVTIDAKGAVYSMNPAGQRMFGYTGNEYAGIPFTVLVPTYSERELDSERRNSSWEQLAQRTGRTTFAQAQARAKKSFPIELSLTEMVVDQKQFYVAMIRDITERNRFEEQIAAERNSLAVTLSSIGDGVITTDLDGRILVCNKAGETMTGWKAHEAFGQPFRTVFSISADATIPPKQAPTTGYRNEAEMILVSTPERATLTSRDGTERFIEQVASPIRDAKNQLSGVVIVFRDITERQRDEAERRKAEALDQLGLLAGGIAHDFNNLLTAIIGNVSLVTTLLPPNDAVMGRLEDAKNASLRARDLAQQLLTFARGGAPIKQSASIADLVQETVSFSLRGAQSRSDINIASDLWAAEFDPGQISQVIANLVVNADQAMPNGGTLHVTCDNFSYSPEANGQPLDLAPGDYIRIRVRDEGVGIPESYLKRIFDPYFTTKAKGSGLGLATTYSVIKNHNGLITVESEIHCGSSFTIYLPAARQQVIEPEPVAVTTEPIHGSGRVLIVDDEEAIRMLVDFALTRIGYEVVVADNSLRGIEIYREELAAGRRFDLVILDLTLPGGMGGKEALKKLIDIDPMVNAVVSSGYATDATMSRYEDFGFRGMIAKPYQASELGRKVHAFIEANRGHALPDYELQHAC